MEINVNSNQQFSINEEEFDPTSIRLNVIGRVDAINSDILDSRLNRALSEGHINIVVDMSAVRFLSSVGIRAVLKAFKEAKKRGGGLRIEEPSEIVRNVLGITALDEMLGG